ncbi:MAG TPA: cobalt-precorrin-5B (C(1))-methyltransferase [Stellaceae bacterium]|nr:cobalt-precorrin-5B (C(1))-methyltransferase [Stellaceae bacterium]
MAREESEAVEKRGLRRGWTTGACAAAAARAAYEGWRRGRFPDPVSIALPGGARPSFPLALAERLPEGARAGIVKDAGDDPDVTHGALVISEVTPAPPGAGLGFRAGPGVGTVTRAGLPLPVGEPAINPGPRRMIAAALAASAGDGVALDLTVTVSIPNGETLAAKTMNGRLGIVGGLSILGTTGIVIPYSCSSWIHSIHRGIDVARAAGLGHIAAATGSTSEKAAARLHGLPETALIDMGDFAGATLKYLRRHPVARLTLAGGFGKLAKLAAGHLDLHSARSRVEPRRLAEELGAAGAPAAVVRAAEQAAGAAEVLALAASCGADCAAALAARIAAGAREVALATLAGSTAVDVLVVDRGGAVLSHVGP